jgi:hypothetical protein
MTKTFVRPPGVTDEAVENYLLTESLSRMIQAGEEGISSIPRTIVGPFGVGHGSVFSAIPLNSLFNSSPLRIGYGLSIPRV